MIGSPTKESAQCRTVMAYSKRSFLTRNALALANHLPMLLNAFAHDHIWRIHAPFPSSADRVLVVAPTEDTLVGASK